MKRLLIILLPILFTLSSCEVVYAQTNGSIIQYDSAKGRSVYRGLGYGFVFDSPTNTWRVDTTLFGNSMTRREILDSLNKSGALFDTASAGTTPVSGAGTRLMWIPSKAAFRAGAVVGTEWDDDMIGQYSFAEGYRNIASGIASHAEGNYNSASGTYSHVEGAGGMSAVGQGAHAEGYNYNAASGDGSHAEGWSSNTAGGNGSHAEGYSYNNASGRGSHAGGNYSTASGYFSFAHNGTASGDYSTAFLGTASGARSFALGLGSTAAGFESIALNGGQVICSPYDSTNRNNIAIGLYSSVCPSGGYGGSNNIALMGGACYGSGSLVVGLNAYAYATNSFVWGDGCMIRSSPYNYTPGLRAAFIWGDNHTWNATGDNFALIGMGCSNSTNSGSVNGSIAVGRAAKIGAQAVMSQGYATDAKAAYSYAAGYYSETVTGFFGLTTLFGQASRAYGIGARGYLRGMDALGGGIYTSGNMGEQQASRLVFHAITADTSRIDTVKFISGKDYSTIYTYGASIPDSTTWYYRIYVVGRSMDGVQYGAFRSEGILGKTGTNYIFQPQAITKLYATSDTMAIFTSYGDNTPASNNSYGLIVRVTGVVGYRIRWTCQIDLTEVGYKDDGIRIPE